MTYQTKAERRVRETKMRELLREYSKEVKAAAGQYVYSGTSYEHVERKFHQINARIAAVYAGREPSDAGGGS